MELGLGLIGIGREWGAEDRAVPSAPQAEALLQQALDLDIRFFDTAPAYGDSEARLGRFLAGLSPEVRARLRIATKFGESWHDGSSFVDHSYDSLCRSLDRSLHLLGRIDLLQVHKCTASVLASPGVARALQRARDLGVGMLGASVSDAHACELVARAHHLDAVQLPLNTRRPELLDSARGARSRGKLVITNRPVDSGHMLAGADADVRADILRESFSFLQREGAADVVLSGTRSVAHLRQNHAAFYPVSIKGVLLVPGGVVLVRNPRDEWELPGGRVNEAEDPAQALSREFAEELSVAVNVAERIDSYQFEVIPGRRVFIVTYGCTLAGEFAPRLSAEHTGHCLWPVDRLSEINLPEGYRRSVERWARAQR